MLEGERRTGLRKALDQLPSRKRQVLEDYYFRGMSLDEIGKGLGLSRSRICRIHAKSLELVRSIMLEGTTSAVGAPPPGPPARPSGSAEEVLNRRRQLSANPFDK